MEQELTSRQRAISTSFLTDLAESDQAHILATAHTLRIGPGQLLMEGQDDFAGIVVRGLLRVYSVSRRGHPVTYRNVARGEAVGLGAMVGIRTGIGLQAVTASQLLQFDLRVIAHLRATDASFNLALAREVMRRLADTSREVVMRARGSSLQLVARHLLDLAAEIGDGDPVSVRVTHEEVADALQVRRETVTRALSRIEPGGLIRMTRGRILILDPVALRSIAMAHPPANDHSA